MKTASIQSRWGELLTNFTALLGEVTPFLTEASKMPVAAAADIRRDAEDKFREAEKRLHSLQTSAIDAALDTARSHDRFIRRNAWAAIGGAALLGMAAGIALSRYQSKAPGASDARGSDDSEPSEGPNANGEAG